MFLYEPSFSPHIWRATYVKSNSGQDVVVTRLPGTGRAARDATVRAVAGNLTWLIGLLAGLGAWLTAWRVVIPRRLGVPYRWRGWKLYRDALAWAALYPIVNLIALAPIGLIFMALDHHVFRGLDWLVLIVLLVLGLLLLAALLGLVNSSLYARLNAEKLHVRREQAFKAYMSVALMANALYLAFAAGYCAIVGAF